MQHAIAKSEVSHEENNRVEKNRALNMSHTEENKAISVVSFDKKKRATESGQPNSGKQPHF